MMKYILVAAAFCLITPTANASESSGIFVDQYGNDFESLVSPRVDAAICLGEKSGTTYKIKITEITAAWRGFIKKDGSKSSLVATMLGIATISKDNENYSIGQAKRTEDSSKLVLKSNQAEFVLDRTTTISVDGKVQQKAKLTLSPLGEANTEVELVCTSSVKF